jgi:hypothetical protein
LNPRTGTSASAIHTGTIPRDGRTRVPAHCLLHYALLLVDAPPKDSLVCVHLAARGVGTVSDFDHVAFDEVPLLRGVIRHPTACVQGGGGEGGQMPLLTPTN